MDCRERMEAYLRENDAPFEVKRHETAYTMSEVAAASGAGHFGSYHTVAAVKGIIDSLLL